ncbi:hypothetical protein BAX51_03340 [Mycoplasmoides gallisepticum]|uniref:Uncharacterized protein n=1 Tax=Mycoplasmoides gallisepticum TaxID=2096 RepID=A0AB36DSY2_MYCGL|nr:hypothetical protein BAY36_02120 [Mycoplasmoides gallisepticum]OBU79422.1 hypothetical protein BAY37_00690 [Mycoplasmoides gallisepticum]OBU80062.1 hypothetical protein BAX51_03340 [Mycoplasmoides gallisepticum]OBU81079.1 hypothetical protein BAX52_00615 [Mycoplasmoides gallisepticum]OBU81368.1 hypothetical protein BAX53_00535 [Mycoplasmoides gallisepticum]
MSASLNNLITFSLGVFGVAKTSATSASITGVGLICWSLNDKIFGLVSVGGLSLSAGRQEDKMVGAINNNPADKPNKYFSFVFFIVYLRYFF